MTLYINLMVPNMYIKDASFHQGCETQVSDLPVAPHRRTYKSQHADVITSQIKFLIWGPQSLLNKIQRRLSLFPTWVWIVHSPFSCLSLSPVLQNHSYLKPPKYHLFVSSARLIRNFAVIWINEKATKRMALKLSLLTLGAKKGCEEEMVAFSSTPVKVTSSGN